ncbi:hypothetical protein TNCV_3907651 [Trichonephila clavipes]|nr:hypothetical protein TNCV_3907651 [Trichonephila clavipes]
MTFKVPRGCNASPPILSTPPPASEQSRKTLWLPKKSPPDQPGTLEGAIFFLSGIDFSMGPAGSQGFALASDRGLGWQLRPKFCHKAAANSHPSLTILRLELCAAVLLAKLVKRVVAALQLETAELYLWSDLMIVLAGFESN